MPSSDAPPRLSVVIPVYNEEEGIEPLLAAIRDALEDIEGGYEVVLVDDGSTDRSANLLESAAKEDPHLKVIILRRNFGQTAALAAGFDYARGAIIVAMDADLQNDPHDIPKLLAKLDEGYDVVSGWRKDRKDKWLTRLVPSRIANWLISRITGVRLHDYGCTLKAYRREVLEGVHLYGEMHRFIPALVAMVGGSVVEVPVKHHPRRFGRSKYGLARTVKVVLDLVTVKFLSAYSTKPIYLFGGTGLGLLAGAFLSGTAAVVMKLAGFKTFTRNPLTLLTVALAILAAQFLLMGLLAEMITRTYHESQGKPIYVVKRNVNLGPDE